MTRARRPVGRPLHSGDTGPATSTLRGAKKKLIATVPKSKFGSSYSKQTVYENSNRNKNALFAIPTKSERKRPARRPRYDMQQQIPRRLGIGLCRNDNERK
jgi:hypothetical protein